MDISVDNKSKTRICQRTVAAINFLSNIRVEGEDDDELPGYNCLQGTELLDTYRRQSRIRRKVPYKRGVKRKRNSLVAEVTGFLHHGKMRDN